MSQTTSAASTSPAVPDAPAPGTNPPEADEFHEQEAQIMVASQWKLIWWKFRKHKLAMYSAVVVIAIYTVALFAEFFEPFPTDQYAANYTYAPPQALHLIDNSSGSPKIALYVTGYKVAIDAFSLRRTFVEDPEQQIPVKLLAEGWEYKLLGIIPMNRHIIGPVDGVGPMYLMGADSMGRDLFMRGAPEGVTINKHSQFTASLFDLLTAYASQRQKHALARVTLKQRVVWSLAEAREAGQRGLARGTREIALLVHARAEADRLAPGVEAEDLVALHAADLQAEAVAAEVDDGQRLRNGVSVGHGGRSRRGAA